MMSIYQHPNVAACDAPGSLTLKGRAIATSRTELAISEPTVKGHVTNVLTKLGAVDRTQAVIIALKRGLIHL
jgi:DNA-binding NarL/FixJ family response regulator